MLTDPVIRFNTDSTVLKFGIRMILCHHKCRPGKQFIFYTRIKMLKIITLLCQPGLQFIKALLVHRLKLCGHRVFKIRTQFERIYWFRDLSIR